MQVRILSSWQPNLTDEVIVTVGGYSTVFSVTTLDSLPFDEDVYFSGDRHYYNETGVSVFIDAATGTDYRIFGHNLMMEYMGTLASDTNEIDVVLNGTTGLSYVRVVLGTGGDEIYYTNSLVYDIGMPYLLAYFTPGQTVYGTSFTFTGTLSDDFALSGLSINTVSNTSCDFAASDLTTCAYEHTVIFSDSGVQEVTFSYSDKAGNT